MFSDWRVWSCLHLHTQQPIFISLVSHCCLAQLLVVLTCLACSFLTVICRYYTTALTFSSGHFLSNYLLPTVSGQSQLVAVWHHTCWAGCKFRCCLCTLWLSVSVIKLSNMFMKSVDLNHFQNPVFFPSWKILKILTSVEFGPYSPFCHLEESLCEWTDHKKL